MSIIDGGVDRLGAMNDVEVEDLALPVGSRALLVRIYRPAKIEAPVPVVLLVGAQDSDRRARALAAHGEEAVVVPELLDDREDLLTGAAAVLAWIVGGGERRLLDAARVRLVLNGSGDELLGVLSQRIAPSPSG